MKYKVVRFNPSSTYSVNLYTGRGFYECKGYLESVAKRGAAKGYTITWEKGRRAFRAELYGKVLIFAIGRMDGPIFDKVTTDGETALQKWGR